MSTIPAPNLRLPIVITPLREEGLPAYLQLRPDQDSNEIRMRIAQGDECFAAWHGGANRPYGLGDDDSEA